jgi:hypothetical protein
MFFATKHAPVKTRVVRRPKMTGTDQSPTAQPQKWTGVSRRVSPRLAFFQRNRRSIFVTLGLTAALGALVGFVGRSSEPTYKGWTMHEWLQQHWNEHQYEALIILGTNNLPLLIRQIGYDPRSDRILSYYRQLPPWLQRDAVTQSLLRRSTNKTAAADDAKRVLEIVGPRGAAVIPQLTKLARENPVVVGERVTVVLDSMGEPGERALISMRAQLNSR